MARTTVDRLCFEAWIRGDWISGPSEQWWVDGHAQAEAAACFANLTWRQMPFRLCTLASWANTLRPKGIWCPVIATRQAVANAHGTLAPDAADDSQPLTALLLHASEQASESALAEQLPLSLDRALVTHLLDRSHFGIENG